MKQLHNKILILLIIACIGSLQAALEVITPKDTPHDSNATESHSTASKNTFAIVAAASDQAQGQSTPLASLAQHTDNNLHTRNAHDGTLQFKNEDLSPAMTLLYETLQNSQSLSDAFDKLTQQINSNVYNHPYRSAALTLLIRAHPDLIVGLQAKLAYLPNRFVSYFKEQLPSLTTQSARQRFTQSIIVETLKSMTESQLKSDSTNERSMNMRLNKQIQTIANLYTENLKNITNTEMLQYRSAMFQEWSRNIIIDISLCVTIPTFSLGGAIVGSAMGITIGIGIGLTGQISKYAELPINIQLLDGAIGGVAGAAYGAYQGAKLGFNTAIQITPKKATLEQKIQSQQKKQKNNGNLKFSTNS